MKNQKLKATLTAVGAFLTVALYGYSLYSAYYTFKRNNAGDVILYTFLLSACSAVMLLLYTLTDKKRSHSKANKIVVPLVSFLANAALYPAVGFLWQKKIDPVSCGSIAAGASLAMFAVAFCVFLNGLSSRTEKAPKILLKIASAISAVALTVTAGFVAWDSLKSVSFLKIFYPVLSVSSNIGGVSTSDGDIVYDFAFSTEKYVRNTALGTDETIDIKLAKNEHEGFQLLFATAAKNKKVSVSVTDFKNADGDTLKTEVFKEIYSDVVGKGNVYNSEYADALVPVSYTGKYGGAAELEKGLQQGFFIRTYADKDAKAGEYTAVVTAKNEKDEVILEKEIKATVWDFALPDAPANDTAFSNYTFNELEVTDPTDEKLVEEYKLALYELMLENGISPFYLPYDILDERADKYMSDPRLTSFKIPYPEDDELLVKYYTKVMSNPEWAKKGYFYPIDEPADAEAYERYDVITERLNRLCPGYRMVTPFHLDHITIDGKDVSSVRLQAGKSSILCGLSDIAVSESIYKEMTDEVKNGSEAWWYVCLSPQGEYCNFFEHQDAIKHRILMWQQKSYDFTGLLYWGVNYYGLGNPWETSCTYKNYKESGDGVLVYPGGYIGLDEPVITIRFANIIDGMEDYDYFALAEEKFGREWVDEKIAKVTTSATEYISDHALFEQVRREIGDALNK